MRYFEGTTADLVWQKAVFELIEHPDHTANGPKGMTNEFLPCVLRIGDPHHRWIVSRDPPYNPAFGLVEFVWIITGNNESKVVNYWNPKLPEYSGLDDSYHGAYGFRLRHEFGIDQIKRAYQALSNLPESRQVVLQIWKPEIDMPAIDGQATSSDIPCNMMALLKLRDGRLHWSQIMRSNDIMRGLPYNIIQFTLLQEVMAGWLGIELGDYVHIADSLHVYQKDLPEFHCIPAETKGLASQRFSMSYDESDVMFSLIYDDLVEVACGNKTEDELLEIFDRDSDRNVARCELVKDMVAVIGSDAARRQNYPDLAYRLVDSCGDIDLKMASYAWLKYWEK